MKTAILITLTCMVLVAIGLGCDEDQRTHDPLHKPTVPHKILKVR